MLEKHFYTLRKHFYTLEKHFYTQGQQFYTLEKHFCRLRSREALPSSVVIVNNTLSLSLSLSRGKFCSRL
jgi:hypothetical protein